MLGWTLLQQFLGQGPLWLDCLRSLLTRSQYFPSKLTESGFLGTRTPEPRFLIISLNDIYAHCTRACLGANRKNLRKVEGRKRGEEKTQGPWDGRRVRRHLEPRLGVREAVSDNPENSCNWADGGHDGLLYRPGGGKIRRYLSVSCTLILFSNEILFLSEIFHRRLGVPWRRNRDFVHHSLP